MNGYFYLIPIALGLGVAGLAAFMWSLRSGQYDDLDGAAERILFDESDKPIADARDSSTRVGCSDL
jgi:cbb3-type cytochrome oxidase maturation protein